MDSKLYEKLQSEICSRIEALGYPAEFGMLISSSLGTEKTMDRMIRYLNISKPRSPEDIADEMLAIKEEFSRYRQKKISEHYNSKLNRLMNEGLEDQD